MLPDPFCLVDNAGFQLERSFVQRPSWCVASIGACFQYILHCPIIHDGIPFPTNKSSAMCVPGTTQSRFQFVFWLVVWHFAEGRDAACVVAAFFVLFGILGGSSSVVSSPCSPSGPWGSPSAASSPLAACGAGGYQHVFLFVCVIILSSSVDMLSGASSSLPSPSTCLARREVMECNRGVEELESVFQRVFLVTSTPVSVVSVAHALLMQ